MKRRPDWIAVDWGTSNLRVWAMTFDGKILDQKNSNCGSDSVEQGMFEQVLVELIDDWLETKVSSDKQSPVEVVACGMVGSRQGWKEASYSKVPCIPLDNVVEVITQSPNLKVSIISGICQDTPADVMRGEETQIAGLLNNDLEFDGVICLPGTHSKWVHISAGEIVSFRTFMTGEMFELLSTRSILRHNIGNKEAPKFNIFSTKAGRQNFHEAVSDAMTRPKSLGADLFSLRAAALLHDLPAIQAKARLSGLLIGLELAGSKPYWLGQQVAIIGPKGLAELYDESLSRQGCQTTIVEASQVTLAGLKMAREQLASKSGE